MKALIFDLDGTLVDTVYPHVLAWQLASKRDQSLYKSPEFIDFTKRYRSVFSL